ncbi:hypothetical protein AGMMS50239_12510 [Bacteroidia bacterium]|nr:hypothetical protein AGMMS50239_12510 [Bacteroidia bacterium]
MKHLIYIVICILLLCSCHKQENNNAEIEIIDIDSRDKINFSDLFSEWHLIFPESKDSSFFGLEILRIEKYMDRLYLLNQKQTGKNILCFNLEGRFLFSIDKIGNGPGEYTYLGDFFIDTKIDNIIISNEGNEWLYFDMDGNYLYSKRLPPELQLDRYTREFNDSLYITYCECMDMTCTNIAFLDRNTLVPKHSIKPTSPSLSDFVPALSISGNENAFFYYDGNDTIYNISSDIGNKKPAYFADFGKKQQKFKQKLRMNNNEEFMNLFVKAFNNKEIRPTRSFLYNGKQIAINYSEYNSDNQQHTGPGLNFRNQIVFYDTHTKKSHNTTHINFDIFNSVNIKKLTMVGCFDGYFYAIINSLLSEKEIQTMLQSDYLSKDAKKMLLNMSEESNPIIMTFK